MPGSSFPNRLLNPKSPRRRVDGPSEIDTFTIRFRMVDAQVPPFGTTPLNERVSAWQTATITTNVAKDDDDLFENSVQSGGGRPNHLVVDSPVRLGPHKMSVQFRNTSTEERALFGSPAPNWSFTVTVDGAYAEPRYEIVGNWSGAHAAELDINGVQIYRQAAKIEPPADPVIPPPVNFVLDDPRVRNINDEESQANGVRSKWTAAGTRWGNTPEPPRVPVRSVMSTNFRAHGKLQKPADRR